jgi:UDP-glucose 4-epimerase
VGDEALVAQVLRGHGIDAVMHLAAHTSVPGSLREPERYYANNYAASATLLRACGAAGVRRFVFASSAAVYGPPEGGFASEDTPAAPATPYGRSKLLVERLLEELARTTPLRYVALRYFNVAGCDPAGRIGHDTVGAAQLIKVVCEHAAGRRGHVDIHGTHWQTPDGTGVRDYIHVGDLAAAHLCALDHLAAGGAPATLNVGYGRGYSVREVLAEAARLSGRTLAVREQPPRPGDLGMVIARNERILATLPWRPAHASLEAMVGSTLAWERRAARR